MPDSVDRSAFAEEGVGAERTIDYAEAVREQRRSVKKAVSDGVVKAASIAGTFLLTKHEDSGNRDGRIGRVLLTLGESGQAVMTDSAQSGVPGYQPFSDARGAWRTATSESGKAELSLVMFDFTFPTADGPQQKIARIDARATFDLATGGLSGWSIVAFADLGGNPLNDAELQDAVTYRFEGFKVEVPEALGRSRPAKR